MTQEESEFHSNQFLIKLVPALAISFISSTSTENTAVLGLGLAEKDIIVALRASGFDLLLKIPIKAYWMRKEVLPE